MSNMQIQKTVSQSAVLRNMTDEQVAEVSDGQFTTSKDLIAFMQNPNTEIRAKQEQLLKVRNFLPPQAQEPEIFLLEKLISDQISSGTGPSSAGSSKDTEKLRLQETLFRMRSTKRDAKMRRDQLLSQAKMLQNRAARYKEKLAVVWDERLKEELEKTAPLEEVCAALREDLDAQHKKRLEAFETKMKPIIIKDGPSKKANYKIAAAKLHYEIYALTQRLRLTTIRVEYEEAKRSKRERQVRKLRDEISEKKTLITTVTKGIPFAKIEVRPQDQLPKHSGPLSGETNPLLSNTAAAAIIAAGLAASAGTPTPFGNPLSSSSPMPQLSSSGPGGSTTTLPGLGANQMVSSNSLNQLSASSSGRPPAYTAGPPAAISASAAAAAAARLAEETEDEDPTAAGAASTGESGDLSRLANSNHAIQIT